MANTGEFLKKIRREQPEKDRIYIVHPVGRIKNKNNHTLFIKITLFITYILLGFLIYDLFKMHEKFTSSEKRSQKEDFLKVEEVIYEVEKLVYKMVKIEELTEKEIKSEEFIIKDLADKSIKLPDINKLPSPLNLPQINNQSVSQQYNSSDFIMSRYDFFIKKAKEYEALGNYKYAIFFYLRAFAERQSDYNTKYKIATLYHQIGQEELAIESAREALTIKADFLPSVELLLNIYNKTGKKPADFIDLLERARVYYPNNKEIKYTLAKLYKEQGDNKAYEEIISSLRE